MRRAASKSRYRRASRRCRRCVSARAKGTSRRRCLDRVGVVGGALVLVKVVLGASEFATIVLCEQKKKENRN